MLTKSYATDLYIKRFPRNVSIHVVGSCTPNQRLNSFKNAETAIEALTILRIQNMSPQIIKCPAFFNKEVIDIFNEYQDLTIEQLLNKKFINCFDIVIYIDPTNLKGGLTLKFIGDGVKLADLNEKTIYIKGEPTMHMENHGLCGEGIHIQEALRSTLTGTDYKAFPDLKEVLKSFDGNLVRPPYYKLSLDGIKPATLVKFQARCTKWLERYLNEFMVKRGSNTLHLLQVRSTVGLPTPKCGMKVIKGVKEVTSVAFYID